MKILIFICICAEVSLYQVMGQASEAATLCVHDSPSVYWKKVFSHNTEGGLFTSVEDAKSKNPNNENSLLFSILNKMEGFRLGDGNFHLKLCYPRLWNLNLQSPCNEWRQKSNPATESSIAGFESISLPFNITTNGAFGGLGVSPQSITYTFIDAAPSLSNWWYSVGAFKHYPKSDDTTIPGPQREDSRTGNTLSYLIDRVMLYAEDPSRKWKKIFSHNTKGGIFKSEAEARNKNSCDEEALLYSILDQLENMRPENNEFNFLLCYPELWDPFMRTFPCNEWIQTSNPVTDQKITGYKPIRISFEQKAHGQDKPFTGLGVSPSSTSTFIDGDSDSSNWWYSIGTYKLYRPSYSQYLPTQEITTIPGPVENLNGEYVGHAVNKVMLYVKY